MNKRIARFTFIIAFAALAAGCGSMAKSMGLVREADLVAEVKRQVDPVNLAVNGATDRVVALEKALEERPTTAAMEAAMQKVATGATDGIAGLRKETVEKFETAEKVADGKIKALGEKLGVEIAAAKSAAEAADTKAASAQKIADKAAADAGPKGPIIGKIEKVEAKADAAKSAADAAKTQAEKNAKAVALLAAHLRGDQKTIDHLKAELAAYFGGTGIRFVRLSGFPLDDAHGATLKAPHRAAMANAKADGYTKALGIVGVEDGVPCKRPATTDCLAAAARRAKAAAAHGGFDEKLISTLSPRPEWGLDDDPSWRGVVLVLSKDVVVQAPPVAGAPPAAAPPAGAPPAGAPAPAPPAPPAAPAPAPPPAASQPPAPSPADSRNWLWPF